MIFHHYSPLEFVSKLMNLLDFGSPEWIALPLLCCLSSFILYSCSVHLPLEKATCPRGNFVLPRLGRGSYERRGTIQSDTCLQDFEYRRGQGSRRFLSLVCFELVKVLQAFYKGSRGNEGSWSGVLPRERCSISGLVILKYVWWCREVYLSLSDVSYVNSRHIVHCLIQK